MHGSHLRLCGLGILAAVAFVFLTGGSAGGVGLLIAALVCPLTMVFAMSVLMGSNQPHQDSAASGGDSTAPAVDHR
jgi:ATP/ADP translocase